MRSNHSLRLGSGLVAALILSLAGCGESATQPEPTVQSVTVHLPADEVMVGSSVQAVATPHDASGQLLAGGSLTWESADENVAAVDQAGSVKGIAQGTTLIRARVDGATGSARITVTPPPVSEVIITPSNLALLVGEDAQLEAAPRGPNGEAFTDRTVYWTSANRDVATVSSGGQVAAIAPGTTMVRGEVEGVAASATITVTRPEVSSVTLSPTSVTMDVGESRFLVVTVRDASGNPLPDRDVSWTSSDIDVVAGTARGDSALVTGESAGSAQVRATVESHSATAVITVLGSNSSVCSQIAGAAIFGDDGEFLGRFLNQYHAESVLNPYGTYGSKYSGTSTNNPHGTYGSPYSALSARNPYTSTPPVIVQNEQVIAYYTVNPYLSPGVSPDVAMNCDFP